VATPVGAYNSLARVERTFRSLKTVDTQPYRHVDNHASVHILARHIDLRHCAMCLVHARAARPTSDHGPAQEFNDRLIHEQTVFVSGVRWRRRAIRTVPSFYQVGERRYAGLIVLDMLALLDNCVQFFHCLLFFLGEERLHRLPLGVIDRCDEQLFELLNVKCRGVKEMVHLRTPTRIAGIADASAKPFDQIQNCKSTPARAHFAPATRIELIISLTSPSGTLELAGFASRTPVFITRSKTCMKDSNFRRLEPRYRVTAKSDQSAWGSMIVEQLPRTALVRVFFAGELGGAPIFACTNV
jgi:hypothetical protein